MLLQRAQFRVWQIDVCVQDASSSAALDQLMSFSSGFLSLANRLREQACQFKGSPLAETVADGAPRKDERIKKGRKPAQDDHNAGKIILLASPSITVGTQLCMAAAEEDKHMASSKNGQAESIKHRPMTAMAKKPLPPEKCQPAGKALIHCLRQHNLRGNALAVSNAIAPSRRRQVCSGDEAGNHADDREARPSCRMQDIQRRVHCMPRRSRQSPRHSLACSLLVHSLACCSLLVHSLTCSFPACP